MTIVTTPRHRTLAALVAGSLTLSLAACGDDTNEADPPLDSVPTPTDAPTTVSPTTAPGTSAPATTAPRIDHPTAADEVVLRIGYEGGFMPVEAAFLDLPAILVTGDGRLITQGPQIEIYPGPLLPNMQVRSISEAGIQQLLEMAADHGLLTEREYENPTNIADAPDTVVVISANGETYEHRAYALGIDAAEATEQRQQLADFVAEVTGDWMFQENPELGPEQPFPTETYLVRAFPVDDLSVFEIEPTVLDWPADLVPLAEATDCVEIAAADVGQLFTEADQLTFFTSDGTTYQIAVKPQLPGRGC